MSLRSRANFTLVPTCFSSQHALSTRGKHADADEEGAPVQPESNMLKIMPALLAAAACICG